jgi:hypothetical protein
MDCSQKRQFVKTRGFLSQNTLMIHLEMSGFTGAKVGDFDRKVRRRSRGREGWVDLCGCVRGVSCGCAQVIRLEMLFSMGCRRERGVCPIRECAVPARLRLSACATSGPAHRASSIEVPSVAHFFERLGSMRRVHSLTHQRVKIRTFRLNNAQILKAHPHPNPSRH